MQRHRVVDRTGNLLFAKKGRDLLAMIGKNGVLVEDMPTKAIFKGRGYRQSRKLFVVAVGNTSALGVEAFNMLQLDSKNGGLQLIKTAVVANHVVVVTYMAAMVTQGK